MEINLLKSDAKISGAKVFVQAAPILTRIILGASNEHKITIPQMNTSIFKGALFSHHVATGLAWKGGVPFVGGLDYMITDDISLGAEFSLFSFNEEFGFSDPCFESQIFIESGTDDEKYMVKNGGPADGKGRNGTRVH